jgi:hypothetical protein
MVDATGGDGLGEGLDGEGLGFEGEGLCTGLDVDVGDGAGDSDDDRRGVGAGEFFVSAGLVGGGAVEASIGLVDGAAVTEATRVGAGVLWPQAETNTMIAKLSAVTQRRSPDPSTAKKVNA